MIKSRFSLGLVIAVALLSFIINYRSHVSLLGGGDEGSYIGAGKLMSRSLGFIYQDHTAEIGKRYLPADSFIPEGFRVYNADLSPVQVVSGWNKGFSFLSIPFWWFAPENGWQFVNPVAGAISILVLYSIGVAVSGPLTGVCAALLLATNWLQLWYSRYPMTEVTSQALILSMVLSVVSFYKVGRVSSLLIFSALASISSFVHFANVPMWGLLGMALCVQSMPITSREDFSLKPRGITRWVAGLSLNGGRLKSFVMVCTLALVVPFIATVGYWFLDPGIQRYTRLGEKMATTSGRFSQLWNAVLIRLENLLLFIPGPMWILVVVAVWLCLRNRRLERRFWVLLMGLAVCSFALIISTGVGTPRVLYVARRNVPIVFPMLFLMAGVALEYLSTLWKRRGVGIAMSSGVVLGLSALQLSAFAPFMGLNQGKGMPELVSQIRSELKVRNDGRPQFVVVPEVGSIFKAGMRYVYDVPIINFSGSVTPEVLDRMLEDGVQLFVLDDFDRKIAPVAKAVPHSELVSISSHMLRWRHANHLMPTSYPRVTDRSDIKFYFYELERRK